MSEPHRIFTATLILGSSGEGKTSLLATFSEYLWETHKKVLLLYSWDGGAIPTIVQKRMRQGLLRFFRARTRSAEGLAIETCQYATRGYWPAQINPETGEVTPAVALVPPVTTLYTVSCRKTSEELARLPSPNLIGPGLFCGACKTIHPLGELNVKETVTRTKGFEQVGGVAFDGLTSMTSGVLDHMDHARGAGQIGGEKSSFGGVVTSGSSKWGGTNRADIGFGQTRAREFANNSLSIPYLVEGPVFTALSMEATDEGGLPILGAKLPGRAATDEASSWFGNVMEIGKSPDDQGKLHHTLFLKPFTDAQNRRHLLKTSASPFGVPEVLVDPIGEPFARANLGLVFKLLDEDLRVALAANEPGMPGLGSVPTDYGESYQLLPAATPAGESLPPLASPPAAPVAPVAAAPVAGAAPAAVTVTKRSKATGVATLPANNETPPTTMTMTTPPTMPTTTPTTTTTVAGPPPPPGMKPPAKAPGNA